MKAKEYAIKFDEAKDKIIILTEILINFLVEVEEIAKVRHAQKNEAYFSIFREQDQKFKAFAELVKTARMKDTGFRDYIKVLLPDIYGYIKW